MLLAGILAQIVEFQTIVLKPFDELPVAVTNGTGRRPPWLL